MPEKTPAELGRLTAYISRRGEPLLAIFINADCQRTELTSLEVTSRFNNPETSDADKAQLKDAIYRFQFA